ncbi:hypothetical protein HBH56_036910 [Parastagonospora nodorum]|uniref:Uncharacterized protein n=1 Tax=Phaeosphaeria nodorum (strain SN15 / ATCC MYA-4574 / FGSC 10173) TaxID=321614 RepID=A0A7U2I323_PHANO|nr:hypothetical protein HBH56_036910 [Parastagonospora nodorum]QRC99989.1 hypothetical protein JI435_437800 [Parastagonospora nodorum SN15]KAH3934048.1 hypothetical protein HBH54_062560 [Parastagonospora nodorum]KAH3980246.1 hypothetical protein HBH52_094710 [Parastagonospora nodorum]KAH4002236.1 hypothetical protein HBI10_079530 [Parastagonospora nodorum]
MLTFMVCRRVLPTLSILTYDYRQSGMSTSMRCEPEGINAAPNLDGSLHARDLSGCRVINLAWRARIALGGIDGVFACVRGTVSEIGRREARLPDYFGPPSIRLEKSVAQSARQMVLEIECVEGTATFLHGTAELAKCVHGIHAQSQRLSLARMSLMRKRSLEGLWRC